MNERESLKCPSCGLNQFVNAAETCKRCKRLLLLPAAEKVVPVAILRTIPRVLLHPDQESNIKDAIAVEILNHRKLAGLTARQLAARISCPRTYISKLENSHAQPTIVNLIRIANALGLSGWQILKSAEEAMHKEAR